MTVFNLPDLGEGLQEAEIVQWLVSVGDELELGQTMVEVSTEKAVVEIPAPFDGTVTRLYGGAGDMIATGAPLIETGDGEPASAVETPSEPAVVDQAAVVETPSATPAAPISAGAEVFNLPDLGEGLQEAEIVQWLVSVGDKLELGQTMVEVSTEKAVVEIPAPFEGTVTRLHGGPGDVIATGAPLIEISGGGAAEAAPPAPKTMPIQEDQGTVVGEIVVGSRVTAETTTTKGGVAASTAVRALARKLKVDLSRINGTGVDGEITLKDVRAAEAGSAPAAAPAPAVIPPRQQDQAVKIGPVARATAQALGIDAGAIAGTGPKGVISRHDVLGAAARLLGARPAAAMAAPLDAGGPVSSGKGVKAAPAIRAHARQKGVDISSISSSGFLGNVTIADVDRAIAGAGQAQAFVPLQAYQRPERSRAVTGQPERIVGPRRVMAQAMAKAHAEIAATTIFDEAEISGWPQGTDITLRIIRAIVAAAMVEPALNAWFNGERMERTLHSHVNLGVAVDSPHGLFVPVLNKVDACASAEIRADLDRLRGAIADQSIKTTEMQGATLTLSNYGMIAGRFATPMVSPPEVAIIGIGGLYSQLALTERGIEKGRFIPVSLTFDHRACTGGDAARFLGGLLKDLSLPY
ncbi:MAG: 2-oxo acid dehydrogenase subunit E2 [Sphingomonadales bacterium]